MMLRLFSALSLLSLLPYSCVEAAARKIPPCADSNVCLIFVDDTATRNGWSRSGKRGYVWDSGLYLYRGTFKELYARMDIEPVSSRHWRVSLITYRKPEETSVAFAGEAASAMLRLIDETSVRFDWRKPSREQASATLAVTSSPEQSGTQSSYHRYSFDLRADGQNLVELFDEPAVGLRFEDPSAFIMDERDRFARALKALTRCEPPQHVQVCYDSKCGEITTSSDRLVCSAKLWIQSPAEAGMLRTWRQVDSVRCAAGEWQAEWDKGTLPIDATLELQCSAEQPSRSTTLLKATIGAAAGVLLLLIVLIIGVIFFKRRRSARGGGAPKQDKKDKAGSKPVGITAVGGVGKTVDANGKTKSKVSTDIETLGTDRLDDDHNGPAAGAAAAAAHFGGAAVSPAAAAASPAPAAQTPQQQPQQPSQNNGLF